jgi:hypothetical protein
MVPAGGDVPADFSQQKGLTTEMAISGQIP